ncbi:hypothetical protein [Iodobacter fluviatilis]|uniref:Uncharacterized protein n=1 Tax=Iodobacter fluviatilis TaxID=537 RepID=A0A377Q8H2_9NEIS|nr:hypothetical protein [Iodobacter fluviatilis]TCU88747.1 hypothetical protein EV682_103331 [Iodobacter fluviatilis]STQ91182.1 Uncharacterised protein [Iodobacter fluviatilis]
MLSALLLLAFVLQALALSPTLRRAWPAALLAGILALSLDAGWAGFARVDAKLFGAMCSVQSPLKVTVNTADKN